MNMIKVTSCKRGRMRVKGKAQVSGCRGTELVSGICRISKYYKYLFLFFDFDFDF